MDEFKEEEVPVKKTWSMSLIGPTNLKKFYAITGRSESDVKMLANAIGAATARSGATLNVIFNYAGMIELVGEAHKANGGKLRMLYTDNTEKPSDWDSAPYISNLSRVSEKVKFGSWHETLLSLVSESEVILCCGLSAGVYAELAYIKWNTVDHRGKVKKLIGIKEFLRTGDFPPEITMDLKEMITLTPATALAQVLEPWKTALEK